MESKRTVRLVNIEREGVRVMDEHTVSFPQLMRVVDVAQLLSVPPSTVHHWACRGDGPPSFKIGKHRRFTAEAVAKWLAEAQAGAV